MANSIVNPWTIGIDDHTTPTVSAHSEPRGAPISPNGMSITIDPLENGFLLSIFPAVQLGTLMIPKRHYIRDLDEVGGILTAHVAAARIKGEA